MLNNIVQEKIFNDTTDFIALWHLSRTPTAKSKRHKFVSIHCSTITSKITTFTYRRIRSCIFRALLKFTEASHQRAGLGRVAQAATIHRLCRPWQFACSYPSSSNRPPVVRAGRGQGADRVTKTSKRKRASVIRGTYRCTGIEKGSRWNEVVKRFFPPLLLFPATRGGVTYLVASGSRRIATEHSLARTERRLENGISRNCNLFTSYFHFHFAFDFRPSVGLLEKTAHVDS